MGEVPPSVLRLAPLPACCPSLSTRRMGQPLTPQLCISRRASGLAGARGKAGKDLEGLGSMAEKATDT